MSKKPEQNPAATYMLVAGVAGEIGCLMTLTVGGTVILGLLLDQTLGTRPFFLFVLLLGSIPLNLWAVYRYTRYKTRNLQSLSNKEVTISDD
jgi:F0F1-type ATP synthase assembly protein I